MLEIERQPDGSLRLSETGAGTGEARRFDALAPLRDTACQRDRSLGPIGADRTVV